MGCDTAQSSAIGTAGKINDLDALASIKRALETPFTTFRGLLSVISSRNLQIAIDLPRIEPEKGRVAYAELDKDGQVHIEVYAYTGVLEIPGDVCPPEILSRDTLFPCSRAPVRRPPLRQWPAD
jgi:hypothetical protein